MEKFLKSMGIRLSTRRKQLRLTQEELAEKANVTAQMISSAELGKKAMRPDNIVKICNALSISTDYLLTGQISEIDLALLQRQMVDLPSHQLHCLEEIIKNYLLGCGYKC